MGYLHRWLAHDRFEAAREDQRIMGEIEARERLPPEVDLRRPPQRSPLRVDESPVSNQAPVGAEPRTRSRALGPKKATLRPGSE